VLAVINPYHCPPYPGLRSQTAFPPTPGGGNWGDFPRLLTSGRWLFVSTNSTAKAAKDAENESYAAVDFLLTFPVGLA